MAYLCGFIELFKKEQDSRLYQIESLSLVAGVTETFPYDQMHRKGSLKHEDSSVPVVVACRLTSPRSLGSPFSRFERHRSQKQFTGLFFRSLTQRAKYPSIA